MLCTRPGSTPRANFLFWLHSENSTHVAATWKGPVGHYVQKTLKHFAWTVTKGGSRELRNKLVCCSRPVSSDHFHSSCPGHVRGQFEVLAGLFGTGSCSGHQWFVTHRRCPAVPEWERAQPLTNRASSAVQSQSFQTMLLRLITSHPQADVSLSPIPFASAGQEQAEWEGRTLAVTRSALQSNRIQRCRAECRDCRGFTDPPCKAYSSRTQTIPAFPSHKPGKALTISTEMAPSGEQDYIQLQLAGWMQKLQVLVD